MRKKILSFALAAVLAISSMPMGVSAAEVGTAVEETSVAYSTGELAVDASHFPDAAFREYLLAEFDSDGDGYINPLEVKSIYVDGKGISSLKGIEYFTALKALDCSGNNLSSLDVSKNTVLESLDCAATYLSSLDVSKNTALVVLDCSLNSLSSLNVSKNTALYRLDCFDNKLSSLDVSKNTALEVLECFGNNLSSLDVSKNAELIMLHVSYDNLQELNISNTNLGASWNGLILEISGGSTMLDLSKIKGINFASIKDPAFNASNKQLNFENIELLDSGYYWWDSEISGLPFIISFRPTETPAVTVSYRTHVQSIGWQNYVSNGKMAGTSGQAKRLEGINIKVEGNPNLGIQYTTHVQSYGWLPWSSNGDMSGTEGEAKRLEAIKIQLTGADKDKYDVYYRVHAQSYGWLGWAKNGEPAGTAGYAKRLEGIQILVVKKGESINKNQDGIASARNEAYVAKAGTSPVVGAAATSNTNPVIGGTTTPNVSYRTHVQTYGWQGWKYNGQMSGTSGEAKRLEGINIRLTNMPYSGGITYRTHVQKNGWMPWVSNGTMSGTQGEKKRLEAIEIKLTGEMANHYDVYYRVHAQSYGWLGWAKNGASAGTAGYAKRLEGIQIVLVPRGSAAPANNYGGITSANNQAYVEKK